MDEKIILNKMLSLHRNLDSKVSCFRRHIMMNVIFINLFMAGSVISYFNESNLISKKIYSAEVFVTASVLIVVFLFPFAFKFRFTYPRSPILHKYLHSDMGLDDLYKSYGDYINKYDGSFLEWIKDTEYSYWVILFLHLIVSLINLFYG